MDMSSAERKVVSAATGVSGTSTQLASGAVSKWSRFEDPFWVLTARCTIYWSHLPMRGAPVAQVDFDKLMRPVRQLAKFLLEEEGMRPATIRNLVGALKEFAVWMLSRGVPLTRYRHVTASLLDEFAVHISKQPVLQRRKGDGAEVKELGRSSFMLRMRALGLLHEYRDRLEDGLYATTLNLLPDRLSEQYRGVWQSKTLPIPDADHQALLGVALDFIRDRAADLITGLKKFIRDEQIIQITEGLQKESGGEAFNKEGRAAAKKIEEGLRWSRKDEFNKTGTRLSVVGIAKLTGISPDLCLSCLVSDKRLKDLFRNRRNFWGLGINWEKSDLYNGLRLLQTSCFIIIATSTGMRLGELLALKPGCLVKRRIRGYEGPLYWLKSTLVKTSSTPGGEDAFWLCGELAARAISILERLHASLPTTLMPEHKGGVTLEDSLFRAYVWTGVTLEARPVTSGSLYNWLKLFIDAMNLSVGHVYPHQFRRTFARNVVRWSSAPILALQRHFKHWSLLMTDYYVGIDDELIQVFLSERIADSRERLRQILAGECGGPGGLISQKRLTRMADNEELPLNFRGREHAGTIETLLDEICGEGVLAYKCGDFTTCLYVPGVAKCGEDGPKEHECHPTECPNSHIMLEDVPFYLNNARQNQLVYDQLSEAERGGPFGLFLLQRIRRDLVAIRPLAPLYAEKLRQLQAHYDRLTEPERVGSYGQMIRNRVERETATLKLLIVK